MKLTIKQSQKILVGRGVYVTEACDRCGQLLAEVRFTVKGEPGEWCSRECRDGADAMTPGKCQGCGAALNGKRKSASYCGDACKMRHRRADGKESQSYRNTPIADKGLSAAKTASAPLSPMA